MISTDPAKAVTVTVPEMLDVLNNGNKGAKIMSLVALTFPDMLKTNRETGQSNPFNRGVSRLAHRNVMVGVNYEAAVNRTRLGEVEKAIAALEADALMDPTEKMERLIGLRRSLDSVEYFHAEQLWHGYGVSVLGQPYLVTHRTKGGLYFATKPYQVPTDAPESITGTLAPVVEDVWRNVATDEVLDQRSLSGWLRLPSKAKKQDVEHDVLWRVYGIDGGGNGTAGRILQVRYGGHHYLIDHN
jgi:hypothetical protein